MDAQPTSWGTDQIEWLARRDGRRSLRDEWKGLTSVIVVESIRRLVGSGDVQTNRRYFISSLPTANGQRFANLIRNHWPTENSQHWSLDMAFNEDQNRVRKHHGIQNLAVLRRVALGLLRRDKSVKLGEQLIFNLACLFQAIKYLPIEQSAEISVGHGFEPIMLNPILPAESVQLPNAREQTPNMPETENRSASRLNAIRDFEIAKISSVAHHLRIHQSEKYHHAISNPRTNRS